MSRQHPALIKKHPATIGRIANTLDSARASASGTVNDQSQPMTWVVHDGRAGNSRQALALARAFDSPFREFVIELAVPWRWLAPHARWPWPLALPHAMRGALQTPPACVIGCGRAAAFTTAMLRAHLPGCLAIQILDPRIPPRHFDWVITPAHDALGGDNVITTLGALNPIDPRWLDQAAQAHATLAATAAPHLAVLVGGPHRDWAFDLRALERLLQSAADWQSRCGGSVWLTTSRRTPPALGARIVAFAAAAAHRIAYVEASATLFRGIVPALDATNPYAGFLAMADALMVTADSVNLASEACATGKPVFVFEPERARDKLARFHSTLGARGHTTAIAGITAPGGLNAAPLLPLREAAEVADLIRRKITCGHRP